MGSWQSRVMGALHRGRSTTLSKNWWPWLLCVHGRSENSRCNRGNLRTRRPLRWLTRSTRGGRCTRGDADGNTSAEAYPAIRKRLLASECEADSRRYGEPEYTPTRNALALRRYHWM